MQPRSLRLFTLCLALALAVPSLAWAQRRDRDNDGPQETENVDRTLTLAAGGTVRLKTFSGRVTITAGSGNQVVIKAVRRATADRLRDIKLDIQQNGSTIEIDANHRIVERRNDNVVETDFDIQVPSRTTLDLRTFSAPVIVTGVSGDLTVDGFSSDVRLTDVAGPVRVKTFSGNISVAARSWTDGDDLRLETFSADMTVRLPDNARGAVEFDSFSGSFNSELPVAMNSSSKRAFRGTLNGGGNTDFRMKTFSGDVTIRR